MLLRFEITKDKYFRVKKRSIQKKSRPLHNFMLSVETFFKGPEKENNQKSYVKHLVKKEKYYDALFQMQNYLSLRDFTDVSYYFAKKILKVISLLLIKN